MSTQVSLTLVDNVTICHCLPGSEKPDTSAACIMIGGTKIIGLLASDVAKALAATMPGLTFVDATGMVAVPGFIDLHVHVSGGGGEAGPASRTPEAQLSQLLRAGITTVVGLTGTDGVTRRQEALLAKVQALNQDITALSWCGSYSVPPATVTGSVQRELCLISSCVGVGEVAISDHRGSAPSPRDLLRLGLEARVGGMLSGKAGIVHCHMGPGAARLQPLRSALELGNGDLPITTFHPTHIDRSPELMAEGADWLRAGGTLDLTCGSAECRMALRRYRFQGLPLQNITVSTDSYGSLPVFDQQGHLIEYDVADPGTMLSFLHAMVLEEQWALVDILPLMTCNPATLLRLGTKGSIALGYDADILLLDAGTLALSYVWAKGELVLTPEWVRGGMFERGPGIRPRHPVNHTR